MEKFLEAMRRDVEHLANGAVTQGEFADMVSANIRMVPLIDRHKLVAWFQSVMEWSPVEFTTGPVVQGVRTAQTFLADPGNDHRCQRCSCSITFHHPQTMKCPA